MAKRQGRAAEAAEPNPNVNPFLKAADLKPGHNLLLLTGWTRRVPPHVARGISFPEQIVIEVQTENEKLFDFGIGVGSPNHKMLHKAMGPTEQHWRGTIVVERQQGRNAPFIAIVEAAAQRA